MAAAIVADRAVTDQMDTLSRVIPGPLVRQAAGITHETVMGLATAIHMPDPQREGQKLDETLAELRLLYETQEETAGAQPTASTDTTTDNPLLQIGSAIRVVKELKGDLHVYSSRSVPRMPLGGRLVVRAALALQARRGSNALSRVEAADVLANKSLRNIWPRSRSLLVLGQLARLLR